MHRQSKTEGISFLDDKRNDSTQNQTKKLTMLLNQSVSEDQSMKDAQLNRRSFSVGSVISRTNLSVNRRESLFRSFPELEREFGNLDKLDLKMLLAGLIRNLFFIDIFCSFTDIAVVTWLYFDHFDYIENYYVVSGTSNLYRLICLIISLLVCIALIFRSFKNSKIKNVKFLLSMRSTGMFNYYYFFKFPF
jgi:hypothetical protein